MANKFYGFDISVTGGTSGICEAPDEQTAIQWIKDEYTFGDLDVDEINVFTREIPEELARKAPRIDVRPD